MEKRKPEEEHLQMGFQRLEKILEWNESFRKLFV